jgi:hypothetical protein
MPHSEDVPKARLVRKANQALKDQNFMQMLSLTPQALFEVYRALTASLLIVFVTQTCSGGECSAEENAAVDDDGVEARVYTAGLAVNYFTLAIFMTMYAFEIKRELLLIEYLEENVKKDIDNESVGEALKDIDEAKLQSILQVEKWYKYVGAFAIAMYLINLILSAIIISRYSDGFYTIISFATFVLFIAKKFIAVFWIIYSDPNVFLSAYLTNTLQYNDVDPKHKLSTETVVA